MSKKFTGISYLFEMLSRRWYHTEIYLGYTKFYALQKEISRGEHSTWTAKVKEGNFVS